MIDRPYTTAIFAMSADGKISDYQRSGRKFGSQQDFRQLEECVAASDAVLMGAGTLRSGGTAMRVLSDDLLQQRHTQGKPPQPRQLIVSRSGNIPRDLKFFHQPIPRWLVTTVQGAELWRTGIAFDHIWVCECRDPQAIGRSESAVTRDVQKTIHLELMLHRLKGDGVHQLAVLGGGALVADLFDLGAIDEIRLTICPLILGGATAPTPVDGLGFLNQMHSDRSAPQLTLLAVQPVNQEIFLRYRVSYSHPRHHERNPASPAGSIADPPPPPGVTAS
ncbi:MAG: riboflavin deaminase [Oscillatoriales cyanobacterium]|nr:MAG: riboflavin deaminase [Oscillatoriales cyanobacterium]